MLFAVLCEDFESPKMVWNFSTLRHLTECLNAASKELDAERSIRYEQCILFSRQTLLILLMLHFLIMFID